MATEPPKGGPRMYWVAVGLAGSSLSVSVAILWIVSGLLRSTRRAELVGDERLEILREQQERASRANSYALSRQRAGVTDHDESQMKEFADDEAAGEPAITDVRRQIESIDTELAGDHGGGPAEAGRRAIVRLAAG